MTVQNACLIFILAFSGITGWLLLREPAEITVAGDERAPDEQVEASKPQSTVDDAPAATHSDHQSLVRQRLNSIVIPVLDLKEITIEEAMDFLRLRSRELNTDSTTPAYGISFVIRKPRIDGHISDLGLDAGASPAVQLINVYAENIRLTDALDIICEKAGCHWEIDDHHVLILPN